MRVILPVLLAFALSAEAAPLTLPEALRAADTEHPELQLAQADLAKSKGELIEAEGANDPRVAVLGQLARVRPSLQPLGYDQVSDNWLVLRASTMLYDFGRAENSILAAKAEKEAKEDLVLDTRSRRRLTIMQRFFDVLLADQQSQVDDEYMAVAYVDYDKGRDRLEVGSISPVDLARLEAGYNNHLVKRNQSRKNQQLSRQRLAIALGTPEELPEELAEPDLEGLSRIPKPLDALLDLASKSNPAMLALDKQLAASRLRMEALRADDMPRLEAEAQVGNYQRDLSGRDDTRVGVLMYWPLYEGGRREGKITKEQAAFYHLQAEVAAFKLALRERLLELVVRIEELQGTRTRAAAAEIKYRELALEKARGQYETEIATTLGTSMAASLEARLAEKQLHYNLALAMEQLRVLVGRPLGEITEAPPADGAKS